jgi:DNA-binding CsgD family transcriptional regulator/predicted negative regulator of RcsB-dependent stress response
VPSAPDDPRAAADRALADADWPATRDAFRAALAAGEDPEVLAGLADALWWLGDIRQSMTHRERAFALFRERGDPLSAAALGWLLSLDHCDNLGNTASGRGWLARTRRLVDEHALEPLRGWVLLLEAHVETDPIVSERLAGQALELGREVADAALQLCALNELGAALVDQGRVAEGVAMLDESMAGALAGEGGRPEAVAFTSCNTLQACTSCADVERAVQWLRASDQFAQRFGSPYVRADCRLHYAGLLLAIGDWTQAEEELATAVRLTRGSLPVLHRQALCALAELRLAQGRVEEAARLVSGQDGQPWAATALGRLHLRQGRPHRARTVLQRGLAATGADRLRAVSARELLGEALIAGHEVGEARTHALALAELGSSDGCAVAAAYGARLHGRVAAAGGKADLAAAREHLEAALAGFVEVGLPWEAARTRLLLAHVQREVDPDAAVDEARAALTTLDGLGARADADDAAALLRALGAPAARSADRAYGELTRREQEVLDLLGEGLSNPEIAGRLYLSRKTVEHHVARVLSKLGLRSRAEAAAEAVRRGREWAV